MVTHPLKAVDTAERELFNNAGHNVTARCLKFTSKEWVQVLICLHKFMNRLSGQPAPLISKKIFACYAHC